ncbi:hypothetical protein [Pseudomonas aeruginosa]|uniref:hypothetical protein n=1 Tax=Pseudomonas aeruginosa TaxID=287 RepID=UPI000AFA9776|nr:hypothetical protein [Pseudomonas aeruginosa]WGV69719.1 hypothetical protein QIU11_13480 [Pseudomonas aeruginosa]
MSNELTDVRCPCGAEFQADSYDAGFIAGSGMCQNCDAALPPKDICTCPSGDGSLRHPCPAHPASVELAGVGAKLTFINGRPAMCGCQVEYSSGGGEYSDVIDVTLCAKHSGSAILDLVATNRIALTPEYEGQWHADFYLDREIPLAKAEGATPAEAVLALMSAERIDPEQESVEQAGGDERAADEKPRATRCPDCGESDLMPGDLCACGYETDPAAGCACPECDGSGDGYVGEVCRECDGSGWFVTPEQARAALAQPSQAIAAAPTYQFQSREIGESDWAPCDFRWYLYCSKSPEMDTRVVEVAAQPSPVPADEKPGDSILCSGCFAKGVGPEHFDEAGKCLARQQTEPLGAEFAQVLSDNLPELLSTGQAEQAEAERPEVVARVVHSNPVVLDHCGPLNANDELMTVAQHAASVARWAEMFNRVEQERDAALARVAELEKQEPVAHLRASDLERLNQPGIAGSAGSLWNGPREGFVPLYAAPVAQPEETPGEILAAKLIETWVTKHGKPAPWSTAVEITAVATNMPNDERERLLALDDDVDAQAQHSVP